MRTFPALFIAAAFALSANAYSINPPIDVKSPISVSSDTKSSIPPPVNTQLSVSAPVQTCINAMTSASKKAREIANAVASYNSASGPNGVTAIHTSNQELVNLFKKASADCCGKASLSNKAENDAALNAIVDLITNTDDALTEMKAKKPQFDLIPSATDNIKEDLKLLAIENNALNTCLVSSAPVAYTNQAKQVADQIKASFDSAKTAYGVV